MTGLDLETFLQLLRADYGAWASLGLAVLVLASLVWTSFGRRRALRKCLVLSILAHVALVSYGNSSDFFARTLGIGTLNPGGGGRPDGLDPKELANVGITPVDPSDLLDDGSGRMRLDAASKGKNGQGGAGGSIDSPTSSNANIAEAASIPDLLRPDAPAAPPRLEPSGNAKAADPNSLLAQQTPTTAPDLPPPPAAPEPPRREAQPDTPLPEPSKPVAGDPGEMPVNAPKPAPDAPKPSPLLTDRSNAVRNATRRPVGDAVRPPVGFAPANALPDAREAERRLMANAARPNANQPDLNALPSTKPAATPNPEPSAPALNAPNTGAGDANIKATAPKPAANPEPKIKLPDTDTRRQARTQPQPDRNTLAMAPRNQPNTNALDLGGVTPRGTPGLPIGPGQGMGLGLGGVRALADIPSVYRTRLDPNRSAVAQRAGASPESEQAVERALDWLARHQDPDGRWDGATAKYSDGTVVRGDDSFTIHCPAGETCFGECYYWEADTAQTGLALLAFLGAGYTPSEGKYATVVTRGLEFLVRSQKPDGDLRGDSKAVGMYCHAMATLALCEAFALTGDPTIKDAATRGIRFIVAGRAADRMAWRYAPGAPTGDTSILGWVVMCLKSARLNGIPVPQDTLDGAQAWLRRVSAGNSGGLARYQPGQDVTPTMTAEAWLCRQFLGTGGPGRASDEAAAFLIQKGPKVDAYNLYYWYYGTLSLYQHGGPSWARWNRDVRDELIRRQVVDGHASGSWAPDDSQYGTHGGRIYCTALATLTLEVYYRYLRLYEAP